MTKRKDPATARLYFPKGKAKMAKVLKGAGIEEEVTLIIKGKISSLGKEEWDDSRHVAIEMTGCQLQPAAEKPLSLAKALKSSSGKV